jgi:hypothetical protein
MALGYLRIALTMTLIFGTFIGLSMLVLMLFSFFSSGITGNEVESSMRFIVQAIAFVSVATSVFLGIGLVWNIIGVALGMSIAPDELDLQSLRVSIPRNLKLYNIFGMPLLLMFLMWLASWDAAVMVCLGMFAFLLGFINSDVASNAWKKVADWYELSGQISNIKKKNVPSTEKLKTEPIESDNLHLYEDDQQQSMKR